MGSQSCLLAASDHHRPANNYNQSQQHRHIPIAGDPSTSPCSPRPYTSLPLTACSQPHHFYHRRLFPSCLRALCRVMPSLQRCQAQPPIPSSVRVQSVRSSLAAVLSFAPPHQCPASHLHSLTTIPPQSLALCVFRK